MTGESREEFRARLLGAERLTPTYQERYEKEIQAMLEEKVTGRTKCCYVFFLILGLAFFVVFGAAAILAGLVEEGFPILARLAFAVGSAFGLAWAALMASILRKGVVDLRAHPRWMFGLAWGSLVVMLTLFLLLGMELSDPIQHIHILVVGLVFLGMGTFMLLLGRIKHSELKTREKLLEIEYRLAEIAEGISRKGER